MSTETTESQSAPAADEMMVRALYQQLLVCWNERDAAAFAALFVTDGDSIGFDGSQLIGQAEIAASLHAIFANHVTASYVGKVRSVRMLSPDVASLRAVVGMVPPGQAQLNPQMHAVQTLVATQRDGQWRIALFQNTPAQLHGRPEEVEQLTAELQQLL